MADYGAAVNKWEEEAGKANPSGSRVVRSCLMSTANERRQDPGPDIDCRSILDFVHG